MLYYLMYLSSATFDNVHQNLIDINAQAQKMNPSHGVTGLLLYDAGTFFQILEGEEKEIDTLFDNIKRDPRNKDVILIAKKPLIKRNFSNWIMKIKDISDVSNINWMAPKQEEDLSTVISTYVNDLASLLIHALKDDYKNFLANETPPVLSKDELNQELEKFQRLSTREKEILSLIVQGQTAKKIGRILKISDKTAARHTENICKKTQSRNKSELIEKIFSNGYLNEVLIVRPKSTL